MENRAIALSKRGEPHTAYKNLYKLAFVGGAAFWVTNFAISLTPVAAEYRAALSISYVPMLIESLIGGMFVGFFVSFCLLRFYDRIPTRDPVLKSLILSIIALIVVSTVLEGPARFLAPGDGLRYFLIGALFNVLRILALGMAVGLLYKRLCGPESTEKVIQ
jgi:NhaP-type Na+/H+ or K+/H+ antiporter